MATDMKPNTVTTEKDGLHSTASFNKVSMSRRAREIEVPNYTFRASTY